jgi:hypothetical protein
MNSSFPIVPDFIYPNFTFLEGKDTLADKASIFAEPKKIKMDFGDELGMRSNLIKISTILLRNMSDIGLFLTMSYREPLETLLSDHNVFPLASVVGNLLWFKSFAHSLTHGRDPIVMIKRKVAVDRIGDPKVLVVALKMKILVFN